MKVWKNGKISILEAISDGGKTWTEIRKETQLSRPVVSDHLKSLLDDGLIGLPLGSGRGSKYEITPEGREKLLREEDRKFHDETAFFRGYDLESYLLKRHCAVFGQTKEYMEVETPEQLLESEFPVFPFPLRATLRMSPNGTSAIMPWVERMIRKYSTQEEEDEEYKEELYKEVAYHFADPTIKKLCEVLFERTRVLCSLHSQGEKSSLPTLDNILNFNIEVVFRYEGETLLNSASKEERIKAQHLLAGTLLLYLGGSGRGPIETFVWTKEELQSLVESRLLTQEEIQPLLDVCEVEYFDNPPRKGRSAVQLGVEKLTDEQKRKITISAYRRFYLADHEDYDKIFAKAVPAPELGKGMIKIVEENESKNSEVNGEPVK